MPSFSFPAVYKQKHDCEGEGAFPYKGVSYPPVACELHELWPARE